MIDFSLTREQEDFLDAIDKFARLELEPVSRIVDADPNTEFPWDAAAQGIELGLTRLAIPETYGGLGLDMVTTALILGRVAYYDSGFADVFGATALGYLPLLFGGNDEQHEKYFTRTCQDTSGRLLWAFGCTEPNSGSDSVLAETPKHGTRTTAVRNGDGWIVNGRKCFITNGGIADYYLIFALTEPKRRGRGMSAFAVPASSPGLSVGKKENKMGMRASPTTDLIMEDLEVPESNRVGPENEAFTALMRTLDGTRPTIAAQALGIAEGALAFSLAYAQQREQFGQPLIAKQGIQFMLADMATQVEAARALLYQTTSLYDQGFPDVSPLAAMSKLLATDAAMRVTTDAVQIMGGYGYTKDYPVERMMRDAKLTQIYEGTNQIQRVVISKWLQKKGYPLV
jgi:alkylation response protein AidB-like acyl-CoA dehydrogenase